MNNLEKKESIIKAIIRVLTSQSNKTPYENWKEGKRVFKAPWIINYYRNITDFNQYLANRKMNRLSAITTVPLFVGCGLWLGYMLWG